jgi:hypothetical protein
MTKKATKATKVVQVAADTITDDRKVKAVKLDGMRKGTAIYKQLAKIKVGMTVADVLSKTPVSRFSLACHVPRGRIVLGK